MLERLLEKLEKILTKTQNAFEKANDPRYTMFASGVKLMEVLELCKKVKQQFYPSSWMGLREPAVSDPTAQKLLKLALAESSASCMANRMHGHCMISA